MGMAYKEDPSVTASVSPTQNIHHRIEEWLNSATHGLGAILSVIGTIALIVGASQVGDAWKIVSFSIFGASLILLYLASALYHGARRPELKRAFKTLDHCAIFLLIAGTYTPFLLVNMRGTVGWTLFAVIWSLAITGVVLKVIFKNRFKLARVGIYVAMGWLITFASSDLVANLSETALNLTIAGSACHFSAIYFGVLPHTV